MVQQRFVIVRRYGEDKDQILKLENLLEQGWKVVAFQTLQETEEHYAEEIYILDFPR